MITSPASAQQVIQISPSLNSTIAHGLECTSTSLVILIARVKGPSHKPLIQHLLGLQLLSKISSITKD